MTQEGCIKTKHGQLVNLDGQFRGGQFELVIEVGNLGLPK